MRRSKGYYQLSLLKQPIERLTGAIGAIYEQIERILPVISTKTTY